MTILAYLIKQTGIHQNIICNILKVPPSNVSTWVNGKIQIPFKHHEKIGSIFNISPGYFIYSTRDITNEEKVKIQISLYGETDVLKMQKQEEILLNKVRNFYNAQPDEKMERINLLTSLLNHMY